MNENNNTDQNNNLKERVMESIHSNNVHMKPKVLFMTISAGIGIAIGILFTITLATISVILTQLRLTASFSFLQHEEFGTRAFLAMLPWFSIIFLLGATLLLVFAIKKYRVAYRISTTSLLFILLIAATTSGVIADQLGIGERLENLPPYKHMNPLVLSNRDANTAFIAGRISDITDDHFVVIGPRQESTKVYFSNASLEPEDETVQVNKFIHGSGTWNNDDFYAERLIISNHKPRMNRIFSPKEMVKGMHIRNSR